MKFNLFRRRFREKPAYQLGIEPGAPDSLGSYVYALIDPKDEVPFYIGQGQNERPHGHIREAVEAERGKREHTPKTKKIVEIWRRGQTVEIMFLRRNLDKNSVDHVEGALISALSLGRGRTLTNIKSGNKSKEHGLLTLDGANNEGAPLVFPSAPEAVFLFNIEKSLKAGKSVYDATRGDWPFGKGVLEHDSAIAVGLENGVSRGAFTIDGWQAVGSRWAFFGHDADASDLVNKNWRMILKQNRYWQRTGKLILEFDGQGAYRTIWGAKNREWRRVPI
ncbi:MAG: hypothetical protein AAGI89_12465 [Pseudomonadota bacterium]